MKRKTTRKHIAAHHRHRPARKSAARKAVQSTPSYVPASYEEIILKNIISNSSGRSNVPDEAMLLSSTLSNLSGSMKELQHKSGMHAGRTLYRLNSEGRGYMFPEESIADLVAFFEKAGHRNVTYNSMPGHFEISIHQKGPEIGANLHDFEAGVISGYLSAAERRVVHVREVECMNNSGARCRFTVSGATDRQEQEDPAAAINNLAEHIGRSSSSVQQGAVSDSYYSLASESLLSDDYLSSLAQIAGSIGSSVGAKIQEAAPGRKITPAKVSKIIKLLHMGNPELISTNPFRMRIQFDSLSSRKGFVELSVAFINGLLSGRMEGASAVERTSMGAYIVDIKEKANVNG